MATRKYWVRITKYFESSAGRRFRVDDRYQFKTKAAALKWAQQHEGHCELVPNDQVQAWWT